MAVRAQEVTAALSRLHDAQDRLNAATLIIDHPRPSWHQGELAGLTLAVKDVIDQVGLATTCGSGFYRVVPDQNAGVIDRIEEAGGVIVARTGLHEFAYGFSSENPWFGPIRNPWDPITSPGGSSGGSAVAVAAGMVDAALGTDTGGSIRVPAAMTGIYGLKVTHGRVPTSGVFPLAPSLDTVGPLARNIEVLEKVYRVISGTTTPGLVPDLAAVRIGIPSRWITDAPAEETLPHWFGRARDALEVRGATLVELDHPLVVPWGRIQELAGAEAAYVHQGFRREGKPYGAEVAGRLEAAEKVTSAEYQEAQQWRARLVEAFAYIFNRVDLLATPAVAARRKVIGDDLINGQPYRGVLSWFSALVNHAGVPAIALPLTPGAPGLLPPPSLQLIAPWWQEGVLLGIGRQLERAGVVGFTPPPVFLA